MGEVFEQWKSEYTAKKVDVAVCFDAELVDRLSKAESALAEYVAARGSGEAGEGKSHSMLGDPQREQLQATVDELRNEADGKTHFLTFVAIGGRAWRELLAQHPPTREQSLKHGMSLDNNPETFPQAAMAASCVQPGLSLEQAEWLVDNLNVLEVQRLWTACLDANVVGVDLPKEISTVSRRAGGRKSTPQSA